jgi:hypothetical protein
MKKDNKKNIRKNNYSTKRPYGDLIDDFGEVLYCPKINEPLLFRGVYELDLKTNTMILFLNIDRNSNTDIVDASEIVHIGWL